MPDYVFEINPPIRLIVNAKHPVHAVNRLNKAIRMNGLSLVWSASNYENSDAIFPAPTPPKELPQVSLENIQGDDWLPLGEQIAVGESLAEAIDNLPPAQKAWVERKLDLIIKGLAT